MRAIIKGFRKALAQFAKSQSDPSKPLVVFIDELDRCKPDYAIAFLDRIKHLLFVPNIVFVVSIDHQQMCEVTKCKFGNAFDADGYLRRFIDFSFFLPQPNTQVFCQHLYRRMRFPAQRGLFGQHAEYLVCEVCSEMFQAFGFSLRKMEQTLRRIHLISHMDVTSKKHYIGHAIAVIVVLMEIDPKTWPVLRKGFDDPGDAFAYVNGVVKETEFLRREVVGRAVGYLIALSTQRLDPDHTRPGMIASVRRGFDEVYEDRDFHLSNYLTGFRDAVELIGNLHPKVSSDVDVE